MKLTNREKWLFILTVFKITHTGKNMPLKMQQDTCEFIRKKICPEIDYPEWLEMEKDMNQIKSQVMDLLFEATKASTGSEMPNEARKMFSEAELGEFDSKVKGELAKINFDELKKALEKLPKDKRKEIEPMFENVEQLAGEYKGELEQDENKKS